MALLEDEDEDEDELNWALLGFSVAPRLLLPSSPLCVRLWLWFWLWIFDEELESPSALADWRRGGTLPVVVCEAGALTWRIWELLCCIIVIPSDTLMAVLIPLLLPLLLLLLLLLPLPLMPSSTTLRGSYFSFSLRRLSRSKVSIGDDSTWTVIVWQYDETWACEYGVFERVKALSQALFAWRYEYLESRGETGRREDTGRKKIEETEERRQEFSRQEQLFLYDYSDTCWHHQPHIRSILL